MKRMGVLLLAVVLCLGVSGPVFAAAVNPQQSGHIAYLDSVYGEGEGERIRQSYGYTSSPRTAMDPSVPISAYPPGWNNGAGWVVPNGPYVPDVPTYVVNPATPINGIYYPIGWGVEMTVSPYVVVTPTAIYAPYAYYRLTGTVEDVWYPTTYTSISSAIWQVNNHISDKWDTSIYGSFNTRYQERYGMTVSQDIRAMAGHHERITAERLAEVYRRVDAVLSGR